MYHHQQRDHHEQRKQQRKERKHEEQAQQQPQQEQHHHQVQYHQQRTQPHAQEDLQRAQHAQHTTSSYLNFDQQQHQEFPQQNVQQRVPQHFSHHYHYPQQYHQDHHRAHQINQYNEQRYHAHGQYPRHDRFHGQDYQSYGQPAVRRPVDRPLMKLSISLIETYKQINRSYYEEREARRSVKNRASREHHGLNNNGWDDENYDYIVTKGEVINDRYAIKDRIGKGSFGQVFRAVDTKNNHEVAIKIIKSKKPFLMQAKTEIELLVSLADEADQHNIVHLLTHFMYRNHQCLVFEMLSLNLYELLKNTQFNGVSLNLIRKFAKQILKSLAYLGRPEVEIIHCDLKPENILLRHPKRSTVKIIDFGSSCKSNKRMYSYIQSRFYRSPEVILGLPYTVAIDIWSLGCILVEMHTGEPLFSGSDQFDQMRKIIKILGMIPRDMIENSSDQHREQFFERYGAEWILKKNPSTENENWNTASVDPKASLAEVIGAETSRKKKYPQNEPGQSSRSYELFIDFIYNMLKYNPTERIKPDEALRHPFLLEGESTHITSNNSMRMRYDHQQHQGRKQSHQGDNLSLSFLDNDERRT